MDIDWTALSPVTQEPNRCGGPNDCEGREYDATQKDCQQCIRECEDDNG